MAKFVSMYVIRPILNMSRLCVKQFACPLCAIEFYNAAQYHKSATHKIKQLQFSKSAI